MNVNSSFTSVQRDPESSWRALQLFSAYRLFVAGLLFFVYITGLPPDFLGSTRPWLYTLSSLIYLMIAVGLYVLTTSRLLSLSTLIKVQLLLDIMLLTLMIHSSDGLQSGMGSLILVVVVVGATMVSGRLAASIAAVATLAILGEASYSQITGLGTTKYSQAGFLGIAFFLTAGLAQWLSHKMQTSEVLAEERAKDVEKLAVLNQHIISRLQLGVMVLDAHGSVTMFNESARHLLGFQAKFPGFNLKQTIPVLAEQVWRWQHHNLDAFTPVQIRPELPEVRATANLLDSGETLLYIENTSSMAQEAQQLKLAALGQLTASIAHEIRNPLGAISHAGEILAERLDGDQSLLKLTDIIQRHSQRMNGIIETILQMSRRKAVEPSVVVLAQWLEKFVHEFSELKGAEKDDIKLTSDAPFARVAIDPEQLHQVVWNLMDNGWHFSSEHADKPRLNISLVQTDNQILIDIQDNGEGVPEGMESQLFEPFHSGRQGGTGLGLYLASELCQANGARLTFLPDECQRSRFRISFSTGWDEYLA
jgi:two-component system sensor histidine kinase PilS (NtrC family)